MLDDVAAKMTITITVVTYVKERVEELERRIDLQLTLADKARLLRAIEVNRRLDLLNGEADRLRSMQETYYPREMAGTLDNRVGAIELRAASVDWVSVDKRIGNLELKAAGGEGAARITAVVTSAMVSMVVGGVMLILGHLIGGVTSPSPAAASGPVAYTPLVPVVPAK